jgi:CubicO group peptidase (beta-lactamase class C family)
MMKDPEITLRDLLDMSSGLDFPSHEHEKMFFQEDHSCICKKCWRRKGSWA